ncbi:hypothetical protein ACH5RR_032681 [Cinchona calisaya]|uniref:Uncharacterized protein n=1 Tax=Cinchona calisaya TaxID=153742 RepID=A0ABD2YIR8_9GENT
MMVVKDMVESNLCVRVRSGQVSFSFENWRGDGGPSFSMLPTCGLQMNQAKIFLLGRKKPYGDFTVTSAIEMSFNLDLNHPPPPVHDITILDGSESDNRRVELPLFQAQAQNRFPNNSLFNYPRGRMEMDLNHPPPINDIIILDSFECDNRRVELPLFQAGSRSHFPDNFLFNYPLGRIEENSRRNVRRAYQCNVETGSGRTPRSLIDACLYSSSFLFPI